MGMRCQFIQGVLLGEGGWVVPSHQGWLDGYKLMSVVGSLYVFLVCMVCHSKHPVVSASSSICSCSGALLYFSDFCVLQCADPVSSGCSVLFSVVLGLRVLGGLDEKH